MAETVEEKAARLERELAERDRQLSGLSAERNTFRQKAEAWERNVGAKLGDMVRLDANGLPAGVDAGEERQPVATGAHPLAGLSSYAGDGWTPQSVDAYYQDLMRRQGYVTTEQAQQLQQEAVTRAYAMARGDLMVLREIDRATGTYKDLGDFASPMSKKTLDVLQKEGYGALRRDAAGASVTPQSWEDLTYSDVRALSRAARIAQAELTLESQQSAGAEAAARAAAGAAGMASGGGVAGIGVNEQEDRWMKTAESGDTAGMRQMLSDHAAAVTGSP